jgi:hypothetical protein
VRTSVVTLNSALSFLGVRSGREHAEAGLRVAQRLGMRPLAAELTKLLATVSRSGPHLTSREEEIAALVAAGLSNAAIAGRLTPLGAHGGEPRQSHHAQAGQHLSGERGGLARKPTRSSRS